MDLATKIIGFVFFALAVAGIIYRQGKGEQRVLGNIELMAVNIDAKIEALKLGQAQGRARTEEVLGEVKAHTGNTALHVNTQFETLREKVNEDFRHDVARKLDELLRTK